MTFQKTRYKLNTKNKLANLIRQHTHRGRLLFTNFSSQLPGVGFVKELGEMMAKKRMFSIEIVDSDAFLEMPTSSQLLYFHLNMRADDDGFINNPKQIMKFVGSGEDDIKLLIAKKFVIPFESGVVVIKHWKIHNYIQADRYHETNYKIEKSTLLLDENNAYTKSVHEMDTVCIQNGYSDKIRLDKTRIDKVNIDIYSELPESLIEPFKEYMEVRKINKWKTTDYAIKLLLTKLNELSKGDIRLSEKIINQSIERSWRSFFPITENKGKKDNRQALQDLIESGVLDE